MPRTIVCQILPYGHGAARRLDGIEISATEGSDHRHLAVKALFILIGKKPNALPLRPKPRPPGIFCAGDCRGRKRRQIAIAAGDGLRAGMECDQFLRCES